MTRAVHVGNLQIGGNAPISVQSMTNTPTHDTKRTLDQIIALHQSGCDLVRVTVNTQEGAESIKILSKESPVPLCADIHFDHTLAIKSIENGIQKLRINPGNIGSKEHVKEVVACAKKYGVPIRIGVNGGSLEKNILEKYGMTPQGMVQSALYHVNLLEELDFRDIVISLKSSDIRTSVDAYRKMHDLCEYPLHVGITEAGLPESGIVKSAIGIGSLLLDGIGDTVRVSLTGDPVKEAPAALSILRALKLKKGIQFTSCPTCGRTIIDVEGIARSLEKEFAHVDKDISIAVMGCVVNGPGEARDKDIALCGGKDCGALYVKGQFVRKLTGDLKVEMIQAVRELIEKYDEI